MTTNSLQQKRCIVVLGPGRSGTSLLMQFLKNSGMRLSSNLVQGSVANPKGHFEDQDIMDVHIDLFRKIGGPTYLPLPEDWLEHQAIPAARKTLTELIRNQTDMALNIWGFKDPRTAAFLPLWFRIFNLEKIIPIFVLAIRNPQITVASCIKQYNDSSESAELLWLIRTIDALHHTGGDCFIIHYEDWFTNPLDVSKNLLYYTGLDELCHDKSDIESRVQSLVKSNLNRAIYDAADEVRNPYVKILYEALIHCHGADFDHDRLMAVVKECRQGMDGFKGWHQIAHQANKKFLDAQATIAKLKAEASKVKALEARIRDLEQENARKNQLTIQIQKLERQLDHIAALTCQGS